MSGAIIPFLSREAVISSESARCSRENTTGHKGNRKRHHESKFPKKLRALSEKFACVVVNRPPTRNLSSLKLIALVHESSFV